MRIFCWIAATLVCAGSLRAEDDLPKEAPVQAFDFEPKLMLETPGALPASDPDAPAHSPEAEAARLEGELVKARKRVAESEQLYREGVLARVEVEGRALRVLEVQKELAQTRFEIAARQRDTAQKSVVAHRIGAEEFSRANGDWTNARDLAAEATAAWSKAELDAAALDLKRKQKLFSEGVGTKREIRAAEDRVALLTGTTAGKP